MSNCMGPGSKWRVGLTRSWFHQASIAEGERGTLILIQGGEYNSTRVGGEDRGDQGAMKSKWNQQIRDLGGVLKDCWSWGTRGRDPERQEVMVRVGYLILRV